jgi:hypothetical protein
MAGLQKPFRIINSSAPTRICDNGGWTDTWFAQYGTVFNIVVSPVVEVQLRIFSEHGSSSPITINAQNYNQRYSIAQPNGTYGKHPLIEAVFATCPSRQIKQSNYPFLAKRQQDVPPEPPPLSQSPSSGHWII